jgi:hypothetical protein
VERDAAHVGGANLFGRPFGNYPRDLVLAIDCVPLDGDRANGAGPDRAADAGRDTRVEREAPSG